MYKENLALNNQQWLICHKTKTNWFIRLIDGTSPTSSGNVQPKVMEMKRYSLLLKFLEAEPNHQWQFSVIPRTTIPFDMEVFLCKGYSQRILSLRPSH